MYWVYITEESDAGMTIGFSAEMDKMLRSFPVPFDALAYKHLLEDLSLKTIRRFIRSHQAETKQYRDRLLANYDEKQTI